MGDTLSCSPATDLMHGVAFRYRWAGDGKHTVMRSGDEVQVHDHNRRLLSSFHAGKKVSFVCCEGGNIVAGCEGGRVYLLQSTILEQAAARGHANDAVQ